MANGEGTTRAWHEASSSGGREAAGNAADADAFPPVATEKVEGIGDGENIVERYLVRLRLGGFRRAQILLGLAAVVELELHTAVGRADGNERAVLDSYGGCSGRRSSGLGAAQGWGG